MPMAEHKAFWRLAGPAAAEGLLLMLLAAADLLMVSSLGTKAVAAVSVFGQPRMVILCFSRSFSVALTAYTARLRGERPDRSLSGCARQSLLIGMVGAGVLWCVTLLLMEPILRLAGAEHSYLSLAKVYAAPALASLFLSAPSIVLHGILAGLGDTRSVLLANVLGNGVNVGCNALLIYGLGPFPRLGVFGAGLGTALGAAATLLYTLFLFCRRRHPATLRGSGAGIPERRYLRALMPLTGSVFSEQAVERFGMFAYSRMVANLGASSFGVHNICMGLCDVYYSFAQGMGKAALIRAGTDLGATGGRNLRTIAKVSRHAALWTGTLAGLAYALLRTPLLRLYHLERTELLLGGGILLFVAVVSIPEALAMTHAGMLRGVGRTGFVAAYSLGSIAILRPVITFVLVSQLQWGLYGAWLALLTDQSLRALCAMLGTRRVVSHNFSYKKGG